MPGGNSAWIQVSTVLPALLWPIQSRAEAQLSGQGGAGTHWSFHPTPHASFGPLVDGVSQVTGERKMTNMQKHRKREAGPWLGAGGRQWGHWSVCELEMSSHQPCWKSGSVSSLHSHPNQITSVTMRFREGFLKLDENHSCYLLLLLQPKTGSPYIAQADQADLELVSCKLKDPTNQDGHCPM